jgi:hypothetical protein
MVASFVVMVGTAVAARIVANAKPHDKTEEKHRRDDITYRTWVPGIIAMTKMT